jgi:hypothetical protein
MTAHRFASALLLTGLVGSFGCGSDSATAPSSTTTSPVTETWTGLIAPGGTASRSFTASQSGTITVTLTSADAPLGFGIGVPRSLNGGCRLSTSQLATSGTAVSVPASAGSYCVQVYDEGVVVNQAGFVIEIVYP